MSEERKQQTPCSHVAACGAKDEATAPRTGASDAGLKDPAAEKKRGGGMSRREFARRAAIASAVASWAPVGAAAASAVPAVAAAAVAPEPASSLPAGQAQQPPNLPKLTPEGQAEAEARFQAILAQYGTRFSEEQKTDLRRLCTMAQPPLDRLRAYNIENGVSPALYLKPMVEREKKPATKPSAAPPRVTASAASAPPAAKEPVAPKKP